MRDGDARYRREGSRATAAASYWWVLAPIGVGTFMSALDSSVVNTLLPVLSHALHAGVATIEWVVTVYLLVVSGLLLSVGRIGDMYGQKRVYIAGFAVFVAGSMLCGLAPTAWALVAFRGAQAVGAAMLFASSPAILTASFPAERRGQALGLQATMTYLGLTVGPVLGGWMAVHLGWRSVFLINVPIGALAIALSIRFVPAESRRGGGSRFDLLGAAMFLVGLVALLLALNQGSEWGWGSPRVLGLLALAMAALAAFTTIELHRPEPMLDLSLFRSRVFTAATVSALMNYVTLYSVLFVLPFYLIRGRGYNPAHAGLVLAAQPIVMAIAAPLSGYASDRIGTRIPAVAGMAILTAGALLLARLQAASPTAYVAMCLCVTGLGTGIFISPNNSALMGAAPRGRQGIAAGVLATARNVGMVLGVGLAGAVFTSTMAHHAAGSAMGLFHAVDGALYAAAGTAGLGVVATLFQSARPD